MPKTGQVTGTPERRAEFVEYLRGIGDGQFCVRWPWSGIWSRDQYVYIHVGREKVLAHRWVYEQINGPLPNRTGRGATGTVVMHRCDNRSCVRPSHLVAGTQAENIADASSKGRMRGRPGSHPIAQKLSDDDVRSIRRMKGEGVRQSDIARSFSVSQATVSQIVHGNSRANVT